MFSGAVVDPAGTGNAIAHAMQTNEKRAKEFSCSIDCDGWIGAHHKQIKAGRCTAGSRMSVCYRTEDFERGICSGGRGCLRRLFAPQAVVDAARGVTHPRAGQASRTPESALHRLRFEVENLRKTVAQRICPLARSKLSCLRRLSDFSCLPNMGDHSLRGQHRREESCNPPHGSRLIVGLLAPACISDDDWH